MKQLIVALAFGVLAAAAMPAGAQTLTYKRKSVHSKTALSQRALSQHRTKRLEASRRQQSAATRQRAQQTRARQVIEQRASQGPRYSVNSTQTPAYVQDRIERNKARVEARRVPGQIRPGVRIVQRRIATDEEMRGFRNRPTPKQRAARAGRVVN